MFLRVFVVECGECRSKKEFPQQESHDKELSDECESCTDLTEFVAPQEQPHCVEESADSKAYAQREQPNLASTLHFKKIEYHQKGNHVFECIGVGADSVAHDLVVALSHADPQRETKPGDIRSQKKNQEHIKCSKYGRISHGFSLRWVPRERLPRQHGFGTRGIFKSHSIIHEGKENG